MPCRGRRRLPIRPLTAEFLNADGSIKIKSLFTERCVRCHAPDGDDSQAAKFPLDKFELVQEYATVEPNAGAMSLPALTQSTHAHLLTFAVLWAVTGLVIAFSSYPGWIRNWLAPIVLVAEVADVACWWLAAARRRSRRAFRSGDRRHRRDRRTRAWRCKLCSGSLTCSARRAASCSSFSCWPPGPAATFSKSGPSIRNSRRNRRAELRPKESSGPRFFRINNGASAHYSQKPQ